TEARAAMSAQRRIAAKRVLDEVNPLWEAIQRDRDAVQALASEIRVAEGERADLDRAANEEGRRRTLADTARGLDEEIARLRERHAAIATAPATELEV